MSIDIDEDSIPAVRGWVTKQGGSHKSWKKRWFQTTPRFPFRLDYYTNDSCTNLKGHIVMSDVTDMITTRSRDKDDNLRYGFQLVTEKRTWKLIVEGEEDGEYWRESFRKLINHVRKSKGLPPLERKKHRKHHKKGKKKSKDKAKETPQNAPQQQSTPISDVNPAAAPPPAAPAAPSFPVANTIPVNAAPPPPPSRSSAIAVAAAPPPPVPRVSYTQQETQVDNTQQQEYDEQEYDEQGYDENAEYEEEFIDDDYEDEDEGDDISPEEMFDTDIRALADDTEKYAVALHEYISQTETELTVYRGQKLVIFDDSDEGGWLGAETINGTRGWVSAHYVKFL
ncbi:Variant sh3 domain containing protein [Entamoeba marina]